MDAQQGAPGFWDNNERAQKHIAKLNALKRSVLPVVAFQKKVDDVGVMLELVEGATAAEKETYEMELLATVTALLAELD
ncbi:MAG: peptide chain release factor 2, partial [Opitutaceae bacterium]